MTDFVLERDVEQFEVIAAAITRAGVAIVTRIDLALIGNVIRCAIEGALMAGIGFASAWE